MENKHDMQLEINDLIIASLRKRRAEVVELHERIDELEKLLEETTERLVRMMKEAKQHDNT